MPVMSAFESHIPNVLAGFMNESKCLSSATAQNILMVFNEGQHLRLKNIKRHFPE